MLVSAKIIWYGIQMKKSPISSSEDATRVSIAILSCSEDANSVEAANSLAERKVDDWKRTERSLGVFKQISTGIGSVALSSTVGAGLFKAVTDSYHVPYQALAGTLAASLFSFAAASEFQILQDRASGEVAAYEDVLATTQLLNDRSSSIQ